MNILEAEDIIKGLPDQALFEEAQMPSGQVPQFLVVSEIQRRSDMRKRFQEQQPSQGTVKDQIVQQGIMGAMPPQMATPMPTGMPTGMPNQMPTGMPTQGMFNGGIIRLQAGGSTGMPGEYALASLMEKAKDLARVTGRKVEDIYEALARQAQENMPNYSMIMPAGLGELPSVDLEPIQRAAQETPLGDLATNISDAMLEARDYGAVPAYAAGLREGITGYLPAFGKTAYQGLKELGGAALGIVPEEVPELVAMPFNEAAKGIGTLITGDPSVDPLGSLSRSLGSSLYDIFEGSANENQALTDDFMSAYQRRADERAAAGAGSGLDPAQSDAPEISEAIATAQKLTSDASKKADGVGLLYEDDGVLEMLSGTGSREVQGTSGRQAQGTPDKTEPSLDFADLLADMKKQTMAQSLVQLGAGIAGGDLSKGISAAGMAAMKGDQAAKALAMRERLAEYQAGREDIARAEKGRQFNKQMEILESRYKNELAKAASVGRNELFRTVTSLVETAMEGSSEFDPAKREAMVQAMMKKYLTAYAPAFDVDPETVSFGVQEDQRAGQPQSEWGVVGR